jgi:hypothetical protein
LFALLPVYCNLQINALIQNTEETKKKTENRMASLCVGDVASPNGNAKPATSSASMSKNDEPVGKKLKTTSAATMEQSASLPALFRELAVEWIDQEMRWYENENSSA